MGSKGQQSGEFFQRKQIVQAGCTLPGAHKKGAY